MQKVLRILLLVGLVLILVAGGFYAWASLKAAAITSTTVETHRVSFPIPFPLTPEEVAGLDPAADPTAVARERAIERGQHLVHARYVCVECHGEGFGGGVMVDDPMIGTLLGPNLTEGPGSRTRGYGPADWDRAVRHGVAPDGRATAMPAEDFRLMSDQELSDIVAYIRSQPPVDNEVAPVRLGPLGKVLVATGQIRISALVLPSHDEPHPTLPPETEVSAEFGAHLSGVCVGCHGADFSGGPFPGGDPSWVPARNLTPHADGLGGWSYDDFVRAMTEGRRPDGTDLLEPMSLMLPYTRNMTDVERQALWLYLQSVPPVPSPR